MKRIATFSGLLLTIIATGGMVTAQETRLAVKHDHLWGSCEGQLIFDDAGVRYETREVEALPEMAIRGYPTARD